MTTKCALCRGTGTVYVVLFPPKPAQPTFCPTCKGTGRLWTPYEFTDEEAK